MPYDPNDYVTFSVPWQNDPPPPVSPPGQVPPAPNHPDLQEFLCGNNMSKVIVLDFGSGRGSAEDVLRQTVRTIKSEPEVHHVHWGWEVERHGIMVLVVGESVLYVPIHGKIQIRTP